MQVILFLPISCLKQTYLIVRMKRSLISEVNGHKRMVNYDYLTAAKEIHCKKQNSFLDNRLVLPDN